MTERLLQIPKRLAREALAQARYVRHLPDRATHPLRRLRQRRRLRHQAAPRTALFICLGNINRSAYAAAVFSRAVEEGTLPPVEVRSAGFIGPGRPSPENARAAALKRGIDLTPHTSRLIEHAETRATDLIVVMDVSQRRRLCRMTGVKKHKVVVLGDLDPGPIRQRAVQDPYGNPAAVFEEVFERIDRCVAELIQAVQEGAKKNRPAV